MWAYRKNDIGVPPTISPIDPAYSSDLTELVFVYVKITMRDTNPSSPPLAPSANWPFAARKPPVHSFTASFFPSVISFQGYPVTEPPPPPPPPPAGSNAGVFMGVGVALGVLLLAAVAGFLYVWLVRRQQREQGDKNLDRGRAAVFAAMHSAGKNRWWFGVGGSLRSKGSKGELTSKRSEGDTGAEKDSKELADVGSAEMQGISGEVFTGESSLVLSAIPFIATADAAAPAPPSSPAPASANAFRVRSLRPSFPPSALHPHFSIPVRSLQRAVVPLPPHVPPRTPFEQVVRAVQPLAFKTAATILADPSQQGKNGSVKPADVSAAVSGLVAEGVEVRVEVWPLAVAQLASLEWFEFSLPKAVNVTSQVPAASGGPGGKGSGGPAGGIDTVVLMYVKISAPDAAIPTPASSTWPFSNSSTSSASPGSSSSAAATAYLKPMSFVSPQVALLTYTSSHEYRRPVPSGSRSPEPTPPAVRPPASAIPAGAAPSASPGLVSPRVEDRGGGGGGAGGAADGGGACSAGVCPHVAAAGQAERE
ncbi:unnamed protein product [Closterium sp. Naga37s-1]|nr:unnamed protein product [Closterium sp. Naga37s-1]